MKKINLIIVGLALLVFTACEKETTGGMTTVTNYPLFELQGASTIFVAAGTSYTEPGVVATENGNEIPVTTTSIGTYRGGSLDPNVPDCYSLTYTATNADGFDGTASRTVYVVETGDLITDISGLYTSTVVRNGTTSAPYQDMEYILIWKESDGTYRASCIIGGYYELGRGYGPAYSSSGAVISGTAGVYTVGDSSNDGFGGAHTTTGFTVNPATKKINFTTDWSFGFTFEVELTQVAL